MRDLVSKTKQNKTKTKTKNPKPKIPRWVETEEHQTLTSDLHIGIHMITYINTHMHTLVHCRDVFL
jgi:kynurenine formamidase